MERQTGERRCSLQPALVFALAFPLDPAELALAWPRLDSDLVWVSEPEKRSELVWPALVSEKAQSGFAK